MSAENRAAFFCFSASAILSSSSFFFSFFVSFPWPSMLEPGGIRVNLKEREACRREKKEWVRVWFPLKPHVADLVVSGVRRGEEEGERGGEEGAEFGKNAQEKKGRGAVEFGEEKGRG